MRNALCNAAITPGLYWASVFWYTFNTSTDHYEKLPELVSIQNPQTLQGELSAPPQSFYERSSMLDAPPPPPYR